MSGDFDKLIDRAVREMLDVEPPADLRARVIDRIDGQPASSLRLPASGFQRFGVLRFGVLLGAAAALVLMVLLARRSEPPAQQRVVAQGGQHEPGGATPPAIDVPAAPERVATAKSRARVPAGIASAASTDVTSAAPAIDPLKTIAPIEVAPIAQSSITPEPIGVRPLDPIAEMQIAPLNPPDRRD
jgi:hypothetical protein